MHWVFYVQFVTRSGSFSFLRGIKVILTARADHMPVRRSVGSPVGRPVDVERDSDWGNFLENGGFGFALTISGQSVIGP